MLDLTLFRKPAFAGASISAFALSASMFSMFLYITLYVQNALGLSPQATGLRFLPLTLVSFFAAPISGKLSERLPMRLFFGTGMTLVGIGLLLMSGLGAASHWAHLLPGFIVAGAGIGMCNPALAQTAVGVVPPQRSGMGSGINNTFRQVGIATGIAGLGALFQHLLETKVPQALSAAAPQGAAGFARIPSEVLASGNPGVVTHGVSGAAAAPLRHAFLGAYTDALNELFVIAAAIALTGAVLSALLVRSRDFVGAPVPASAAAG